MIAPPSPERVDEEENQPAQGSQAMFIFEKHYDALRDPSNNLANVLRGTCQVGQLILRGYEQELQNGKFLRDAYIYFGESDEGHDSRMRLIDGSTATRDDTIYPWDKYHLWYRADDDQRTLMSGQVLLRGMLGPEIESYFDKNKVYPVLPLHTADRPLDVVDVNEQICPRLAEIRERFEESQVFRSFNESGEAKVLRDFQKNVLGTQPDMDAIDCLMTTICTGTSVMHFCGHKNRKFLTCMFHPDRTLPAAVNDYTGEESGELPPNGTRHSKTKLASKYGSHLFRRLFDFDSKSDVLRATNNDAEYAKLAMSPLWSEIVPTIQGIINGESQVCCPSRPAPKLTLVSGHDTTLIPILASLGSRVYDQKWPPYASMVILEIHKINLDDGKDDKVYSTDHAFRLLYNGNVLTHLMDG